MNAFYKIVESHYEKGSHAVRLVSNFWVRLLASPVSADILRED